VMAAPRGRWQYMLLLDVPVYTRASCVMAERELVAEEAS